MASSATYPYPGDMRGELADILRELRQQNLAPLLGVQFVVALALASLATWFEDPLYGAVPALVLVVLVPLVWWVRGCSPLVAGWLLVIGWIAVILLSAGWAELQLAVCLLAVPVGVAALTISLPAGAAVAVLCSALVAAGAVADGLSGALRIVALLGVWGTVGLVALALRPLMTALEWSWAGQAQSQQALEQARDAQLELRRTLADLADANEQLMRLNRLAHGLREAAEEARQAKERFVAIVSHELRTPLNMILGFGEMMLKVPQTYGRKLPPALLADLAVIVRNSQHLSDLVDDVLDLSQIDAHRVALTRERVSLKEIIEAAAAVVRPLFESKHLYLELDVPQDCTISCDRTRIREVVINLLSNAGRFTEQGGVHVRAWREDNHIVVSVADTGPGIHVQDQERLFRPFEQLDGSIRRRYGGAGLGLAISKAFVELHGGRIWVESNVGQGTVFYFRLPIEPPAPAEAGVARWFSPYWHYEKPVRRTLAPTPVLRPRFVVWERGDTIQRLLARYSDGAEIVAVESYEAALRELAATPAQALLVNRLSTGDELERLRTGGGLPYGTPVMICAVPGLADAASALGVADYLVKPVTRERLLAALDGYCRPGATVLIVDDEPEAVQLFWRMLMSAERGYRVLMAGSGREALEMLTEERPDVMLLDLVMDDISGFEVIETCARDPALHSLPIIVLSARDPTSEPIVSDALTVTCRDGLSAPQLLAAIEALSQVLSVGGSGAPQAPAEAHPG